MKNFRPSLFIKKSFYYYIFRKFLFRLPFSISHRKKLSNLIDETKQKKIKKCIIVGNGPSLSIDDLEKLSFHDDTHFFAFNKIHLLFGETNWRPHYFICEDNLVLKQNYKAIRNAQLQNESLIAAFYPNSVDLIVKNSEKEFIFNYSVSKKIRRFSETPDCVLWCGYSVTFTALQFAVSMGYDKIGFIGMDFDFGKYNNSNDEVIVGSEKSTHFSSGYRLKGELWNAPKLHKQTENFEFASLYLKKTKPDILIYNLTKGGNFNFFRRLNLSKFNSI